MTVSPTPQEAEIAGVAELCPECCGEGWTVGTGYEAECCSGSDWECGAQGCTGPVQVQVPVQEQCERCLGTGDAHLQHAQGER